MTNTPDQAIAFAKQRVASGYQLPVGDCLGSLRDDYWGPGSHAYGGTAYQAYLATKVRGTGPAPAGALHFWSGGSKGAGHIALGLDDKNCISTDFGPTGYIGDGRERIVAIGSIHTSDPALVYLGWTRDLDGEVVVPEVTNMIIVRNNTTGGYYHYYGNHIEQLTAHQVLRAEGFGAKVIPLPATDEIFKLTPPPYGAAAGVPKHTHPVPATTNPATTTGQNA